MSQVVRAPILLCGSETKLNPNAKHNVWNPCFYRSDCQRHRHSPRRQRQLEQIVGSQPQVEVTLRRSAQTRGRFFNKLFGGIALFP